MWEYENVKNLKNGSVAGKRSSCLLSALSAAYLGYGRRR